MAKFNPLFKIAVSASVSFLSEKLVTKLTLWGRNTSPRYKEQSLLLCCVPYYKPYKISSLFPTRTRRNYVDRTDVVHKFSCNQDRCNSTYIRYSTNSLEKRISQHRYRDSSIYKHFVTDHDMLPPQLNSFVPLFEILYSNPERTRLQIA